ncbi:MAG: carboxy terminal-processing peptidase [Chthoniobacteraceae bacterium]
MKFSNFLILPLAAAVAFFAPNLNAEAPDPGQVEISVGRLLEQGHYSRRRLDDAMSRLLLKNYLEGLDYSHLYFTQKDVDQFTAKYATVLDDDILFGNTEPAFTIYDLYKKRVEDRVAKVKGLLKEKHDFKSDKTIEVNRQKSAWPKDEAEADQLWRDRIEGELLQEQLAKTVKTDKSDTTVHIAPPLEKPKSVDEALKEVAPVAKSPAKDIAKDPVARLTKRYDQFLRNLNEQTREDVNKIFLTILAQSYDPHSDYMSKSELENFYINMKLSLVGIGAVLRSEDGYAQIMELVAGGPASKDGRLKVGDRVSAVGQGDKEFVDTVDMKLDKVVEMIRGKKDTIVRLQVLPVNATDSAERKVIDIKRDEIKLKEQEAKAEIIERPRADGTMQRLGWITLPSFYADMEHSAAANAKSTTKDVTVLINRLKQENVSGIVMDLRKNGGGLLDEAVNLTGLFIKTGPVVQSKESSGAIKVQRDVKPLIAYDGPLLVLTNRLSASASEIFAAAIQDYGRGVVVGDSSTFGKGTVQSMLEIGRVMPFLGSGGTEAGALKLTIQKFYRIAGGSTQLAGVEPDVKVPSLFDHPEFGESALKGPLPYDTVPAQPFDKWEKPLFKKELKDRSALRIAVEPEFSYIIDDLQKVKLRLAENRISLNFEKRKAEIDQDKAQKEKRTADRAKLKPIDEKRYTVTLDNAAKPELQLAKNDKKGAGEKGAEKEAKAIDLDGDEEDEEGGKPDVDAVRNEAINVMNDLIELSRGAKLTNAATASK